MAALRCPGRLARPDADAWGVAVCGKGDACRAQTVRAHSRENGPAGWTTHDPLRFAQLQGSSPLRWPTAHSHDLACRAACASLERREPVAIAVGLSPLPRLGRSWTSTPAPFTFRPESDDSLQGRQPISIGRAGVAFCWGGLFPSVSFVLITTPAGSRELSSSLDRAR
jgi:hypothetical protein